MTMKLLSVESLWRHRLTLRLQDSHIFTHWRQRETIRECCDDDGKDPYQCRQLCMHASLYPKVTISLCVKLSTVRAAKDDAEIAELKADNAELKAEIRHRAQHKVECL